LEEELEDLSEIVKGMDEFNSKASQVSALQRTPQLPNSELILPAGET
jgi:hypothetical protein